MILKLPTAHPAYVNPSHKLEEVWKNQTPDQKEQTRKAADKINSLLTAYDEFGVTKYHNPNGVLESSAALMAAEKVVLMTGSQSEDHYVDLNGQQGVATLAHALIELRKTVTIVGDSTNLRIVKDCLNTLNPDAAEYVRYVPNNVKSADISDHAAYTKAQKEAEEVANKLLDKFDPDAVVAVGVRGRHRDGVHRDRNGKDISKFNKMSDEILNQANRKKITTISIGNGPNMAGMGGLKKNPTETGDENLSAFSKAGIQMTASNADLGAEAVTAALLAQYGVLDQMMPTGEHRYDMLATVMKSKLAVDAITGSYSLDAKKNKDGKIFFSGGNGQHSSAHIGNISSLLTHASGIPKNESMIEKAREFQNKPVVLALFDSGAGGFIAANATRGYLWARGRHHVKFICVSDFGAGAYGPKSRDELIDLVKDGLDVCYHEGGEVVAMACNTACTSFDYGPDTEKKTGPKGIDPTKFLPDGTVIIDLIATTANAIAEHGGNKPVVLSTEATAKDNMYKNRIEAAAKELGLPEPDVVRVGAGNKADKNEDGKDWATLINKLTHLSTEEEDKKEMDRVVRKYVNAQTIPHDATSIWLCCTHYPAIKGLIEKQLKECGRSEIEVINPMEYQADAITKEFEKIKAAREGVPQPKNMTTTIYTSGRYKQACDVATALLARANETLHVCSGSFKMTETGKRVWQTLPSPTIAKGQQELRRRSSSASELTKRPAGGVPDSFFKGKNDSDTLGVPLFINEGTGNIPSITVSAHESGDENELEKKNKNKNKNKEEEEEVLENVAMELEKSNVDETVKNEVDLIALDVLGNTGKPSHHTVVQDETSKTPVPQTPLTDVQANVGSSVEEQDNVPKVEVVKTPVRKNITSEVVINQGIEFELLNEDLDRFKSFYNSFMGETPTLVSSSVTGGAGDKSRSSESGGGGGTSASGGGGGTSESGRDIPGGGTGGTLSRVPHRTSGDKPGDNPGDNPGGTPVVTPGEPRGNERESGTKKLKKAFVTTFNRFRKGPDTDRTGATG